MLRWWQRGIVYQVYPRSFQDAGGDGIGDLRGIFNRLDYLEWLRVDAVWLSPIQPSPMVDFGYDVSEYSGIDPVFGTLGDFDALAAGLHDRGMKLILDVVPNHTSEQHPWFLESRASRSSAKRDWYLWRDPAPGPGGGPPNNWLSVFGGSAWELDPASGQYYYHAYLKEQPDLNWRNPAVEAAMHDVLRFWLDRGVDGFRVDVMAHLIKDDQFRDNPPNPEYREGRAAYYRLKPHWTTDRPEVQALVARMRGLIDSYPGDRVLIGEIYLPIDRLMAYYGESGSGCHLPFNFQLLDVAWNAASLADVIARYEAALPPRAWPNWVLGNHDVGRLATRLGGDDAARAAAVLLLTLRGTPTLYYGDELGMFDVPIAPALAQDPLEKQRPGGGRDRARTPMPWTAALHGGFTTGTPWLPLGEDIATRNAATLRADPDSILSLVRRLIDLRRAEPALHGGAITLLPVQGSLLTYVRTAEGARFQIALNLAAEPVTFDAPAGRIALSTDRNREGEAVRGKIRLAPSEAIIVRLT